MLKLPVVEISRLKFKKILIEAECETAREILDLLFGDEDFRNNSDFILKYRHPELSDRTLFQRGNVLWIVPIFLILAPFRYLIWGESRVNEDSKLGRILIFLVGKLF